MPRCNVMGRIIWELLQTDNVCVQSGSFTAPASQNFKTQRWDVEYTNINNMWKSRKG